MNFIDKRVSAKQAIAILAKNGVQMDDNEANIILDFLYLIAKNYQQSEGDQSAETPRRNRIFEKMP